MEFVLERYNYWIVIVLMMMGLYIVISRGNLVKKIIGLNLFQTSVFIFYISIGKIAGGTAPIFLGGHGEGHGDDHGGGHGDGHADGHGAGHEGDHSAPAHGGHDAAVTSDKLANPSMEHAKESLAKESLHEGFSGNSIEASDAAAALDATVNSGPHSEGHDDLHDKLANEPIVKPGHEAGAHETGAHDGHHADPQEMPHFEIGDGAHDAHGADLAHGVGEIIYTNPLPHVLILTAIVVGVATTAVGLALAVRIREAYGTIEEDELIEDDHIAEFGQVPAGGNA